MAPAYELPLKSDNMKVKIDNNFKQSEKNDCIIKTSGLGFTYQDGGHDQKD